VNVVLGSLAPVQLEAIADRLERSSGQSLRDALAPLQLGTTRNKLEGELREHFSAIGTTGLVRMLRAVAAERRAAMQLADRRLELVWTGPERDQTETRETSVVVRELFQTAERDVLVAGYALFNARRIFEPLAERMQSRPQLRVRLFVNVSRDEGMDDEEDLLREFGRRLRTHHWPGVRLPEVYFDPRSFHADPGQRAVMHAKCVLIDDQRTFLTSANLTDAAQARNVELGVVINDAAWCRVVRRQFDDLVERGLLRRLEPKR